MRRPQHTELLLWFFLLCQDSKKCYYALLWLLCCPRWAWQYLNVLELAVVVVMAGSRCISATSWLDPALCPES